MGRGAWRESRAEGVRERREKKTNASFICNLLLQEYSSKRNKQRKNNVRGVSSHLTLQLLLREKDSLETEFRAMISKASSLKACPSSSYKASPPISEFHSGHLKSTTFTPSWEVNC